MQDFSNKVVIVTGAAGNLGEAVVRAFVKEGSRVVAVDRAPDRLQKIFPEMVNSEKHLLAVSVDAADEAAVGILIQQIMGRYGQIDILVNAVGGYRAGKPVHETPVDTLDFLFNLNARTVFIASKAVIPQMLAQKSGKIVNVSARAGLSARKNMGAYSASKSAVISLTESMAAELKGEGINVNCIIPGTIDTPENREAMPDADQSRWVASASIADVILFLVSSAARDVHGAVVPVYGDS